MAKRKMHINSLRNLNGFRDMVQKSIPKLREDAINTLANLGGKIIKMAYLSSTYQDQTGNLRDSYVSAVFSDRKLVEDSVRFANYGELSVISREYALTASGDPEMRTGREEAELFLSEWRRSKGKPKGIVLVVAAAMFYSGILEEGKKFRQKYKVITHVTAELDSIIAQGFTTIKYRAHIDPKYISEPSILREGGMGRMQIINM